jgi:hypothetical protein
MTGAAVIGSGNIGTDLMIKLLRGTGPLRMSVMAGIDAASDGWLARPALASQPLPVASGDCWPRPASTRSAWSSTRRQPRRTRPTRRRWHRMASGSST